MAEFSLLGVGGVTPPATHPPPCPHNQIFISPTKSQFPTPTRQQFLSSNPIKTAFLAVVIAPFPFLF